MNIKECITLCTRIDQNQVRQNVKWSAVPKEENQLPQYRKKPLPSHLEFEKDLHDHQSNKKRSKGKKQKNDYNKKDEKFQVSEIQQSIQEVGIGWDLLSAVEKRYRDSQKEDAIPAANQSSSGSNVSFTTARTITTMPEELFLSASEDFEQLKTSGKNVLNEVVCASKGGKERYKRNALIKGILQTKEMNHPLGENEATDCFAEQNLPDLVKEIEHDKENQLPPRKKSIKKDSYQENFPELKKTKATTNSREYFMSIQDEDMGFVTKKSMRKSKKQAKKSVKAGCYKF